MTCMSTSSREPSIPRAASRRLGRPQKVLRTAWMTVFSAGRLIAFAFSPRPRRRPAKFHGRRIPRMHAAVVETGTWPPLTPNKRCGFPRRPSARPRTSPRANLLDLLGIDDLALRTPRERDCPRPMMFSARRRSVRRPRRKFLKCRSRGGDDVGIVKTFFLRVLAGFTALGSKPPARHWQHPAHRHVVSPPQIHDRSPAAGRAQIINLPPAPQCWSDC